MKVKEPNHRLAAAMRRAGCSNKGLARRVREVAAEHGADVRCDHVAVARWLNGVRPHPASAQFIAEALGRTLGERIAPRDIGMLYAEVAESTMDNAEHGRVDAVAQLVIGDLYETPEVRAGDVRPGVWNQSMVDWLVGPSPAAASSEHVLGASPAGIAAIRETTESFSRLDYRFGGGHARSALVQYLASEVQPVLKRTSPDTALGRQFFGEAAALLRLTGWMAYDVGAHGLAQRYFAAGLELAKAADHRSLGGRILAGMSHQANYLGRFEDAANLARAARAGANGAATPTALALFHAMEARALASMGDEAACAAALSEAERYFEGRDPSADPAWLRYFDAAELAAEFAHCFRDLGHPSRARDYVEQSIALSESLYVRSLSFVKTILATSHVDGGDLEQGLSVAREVVATACDLRSVRTRRYVREFLERVDRLPTSGACTDFRAFALAQLTDARTRGLGDSKRVPAGSRRSLAQ